MYRVVCAVNESLYYQMLCKGLVQSLIKYGSNLHRITVLLDGKNAQPLADLQDHLDIVPVQPLDTICGSVPSRTTFARLEIPDLFADHSRILYLDVDTFLMDSIDALFKVPFENLAAVIPGGKLMIKEFVRRQFNADLQPMDYQVDGVSYCCGIDDHKYFNAGVMLINPGQWRALRIKEHAEALTLSHPSVMYTSDEMALNLLFRGHFTELHSCYNTLACTEKYLIERPRIWHFNQSKPIVHTPLDLCERWLSLFHRDDQRRLRKLADLSEQRGTSALFAFLSQNYNKL
jgi:lipopolysaccharide biosynthesis glycosyltransferase